MKLKLPGMPPRIEPTRTEERGAPEPPRDDPRPSHNPYELRSIVRYSIEIDRFRLPSPRRERKLSRAARGCPPR